MNDRTFGKQYVIEILFDWLIMLIWNVALFDIDPIRWDDAAAIYSTKVLKK